MYVHFQFFAFTLGLTLLYFLFRAGQYTTLWNSQQWTVKLFAATDLVVYMVPFALSVIYHTFLSHHSGKYIYKLLLKTDVFGVWVASTFAPITTIYVSLYCMPMLAQCYIAGYLLLSVVVLYYLVVLDCKRQRVVALTVQFIFRSLVQFIRLTPFSNADVAVFYCYAITTAVSSVGALINALHIPERWFPGQCDYVLNGHSLMHIMATLSMAVGQRGSLIDIVWLEEQASCPL